MARRRGRKERLGIKRQPDGRPAQMSERQRQEDTMSVAVHARVRVHKIKPKDAVDQLAGYAIGRMALKGHFGPTRDDYQDALNAVEDYVRAVADFMRIKYPMMPMPRAMDYLAGRGMSLKSPPSLQLVDRIERSYEAMIGRLDGTSGIDRMYFHDAAFHDMDPKTDEAIAGIVRIVDILKG